MARTKVHRVVLLVVDHDDLGAREVKDVIENTRYPNHCIYPDVMAIQTQEVDWDDHPISLLNKRAAEFRRMFGGADAL